MLNTTTTATPVTPAENQKHIENHKKAAKHHEDAATLHHEAVKHREAGNHEKAAESTVKAHGSALMATETHNEIAKAHAPKK